MMNATISVEINKGVQRKSESRFHILPAITIVVLLYTLVMSLTWLRDQASVSLVTRPYTATVSTDESEMTSTILTTIRGWLATASDSAQSVIDSTPVQTISDTALSVIQDFRDLLTVENTVTTPSAENLWIRYLPLEDASNLLVTGESQVNPVGVSE